jgi:hypothetical protein
MRQHLDAPAAGGGRVQRAAVGPQEGDLARGGPQQAGDRPQPHALGVWLLSVGLAVW